MTDPYDFAALRLLPAQIGKIRAFWDAFAAHADELDEIFGSGRGQPGRVSEIMSGLNAVSPDLMWEFGPSAKGHKLSVTAEWRHGLRALARAVVNMAPEHPRFAFDDAREGNDGDTLEGNFEARFRIPVTLSSITTAEGADNKVVMTGAGPGSEEQIGNQVLALGTFLLGEAQDRDWFGEVETEPESSGLLSMFGKKKTKGGGFDPNRFRADFEGTVKAIRATLPDKRRREIDPDTEERVLIKLNGIRQETGRPDLIIFNCGSDAYANAALTTTRFSSINHSAFGEWFFFLRIPRTPERSFDDVGDRYELEEKLHLALSEAGLGGLIGAGHGTEAVYIDLGAEDLDAAVPLVAQTLQNEPGFADFTLHFLEAGLPETGFALSQFVSPRN